MLNPFKRSKPEKSPENAGQEDQPTGEEQPAQDTTAAQPEASPAEQESPAQPGSSQSEQEPAAPSDAPSPAPSQENEPVSESQAPPEAPVEAAAAVEQPAETPSKPQTPRQGLLYHLFSPQTRLGRIMRPVLRWLAAITGLFALGLLAGYLLLYQPTQRSLDAANARLVSQNQTVAQSHETLQSLTAERDQAQNALKQAQDKLTTAASENNLLQVMVDVANARVALVNKDGQTAKTAIAKAQADLTNVLPYLESHDKTQTNLIQTRLTLVTQELASDPQATLSDLTKLASDLSALHDKLFPK